MCSQPSVILSDGDRFHCKLLKPVGTPLARLQLIVLTFFPTKCCTTPDARGRVNLFDFHFPVSQSSQHSESADEL